MPGRFGKGFEAVFSGRPGQARKKKADGGFTIAAAVLL
jgi:hypothetical protein